MTKQRILIVDDEPLARERLRLCLLKELSVEIIGECGDGLEAVAAIKGERPDIVFLDVHMPGCNGLQVAAQLDASQRPAIIFVTAHARFAVEAFGVQSVDYLLKPFGQDRLLRALQRAQEHIRASRADHPGA